MDENDMFCKVTHVKIHHVVQDDCGVQVDQTEK